LCFTQSVVLPSRLPGGCVAIRARNPAREIPRDLETGPWVFPLGPGAKPPLPPPGLSGSAEGEEAQGGPTPHGVCGEEGGNGKTLDGIGNNPLKLRGLAASRQSR
jgi:hypothetical protein